MGLDHCPISAGGYPAFSGHHSYIQFERPRFCNLIIPFIFIPGMFFLLIMSILLLTVHKLASLTLSLVTLIPRARMREAGLSNRFCLSVCLSVTRKKLKSRHIDPHKPSKWSQTIANNKKLLYVYLTEVKSLRFAVFRLFPTFHNYS